VLELSPPTLARFCTLRVELGPVRDLGPVRSGHRRVVPITGGRVTGRIEGTILDGGADWLTVTAEGVAEMDARYLIATHDGALVEIVNQGARFGPPEVMARLAAGEPTDPTLYSMLSTARLESGHPDYSWVNRLVLVGTGARDEHEVQVELFEVQQGVTA